MRLSTVLLSSGFVLAGMSTALPVGREGMLMARSTAPDFLEAQGLNEPKLRAEDGLGAPSIFSGSNLSPETADYSNNYMPHHHHKSRHHHPHGVYNGLAARAEPHNVNPVNVHAHVEGPSNPGLPNPGVHPPHPPGPDPGPEPHPDPGPFPGGPAHADPDEIPGFFEPCKGILKNWASAKLRIRFR